MRSLIQGFHARQPEAATNTRPVMLLICPNGLTSNKIDLFSWGSAQSSRSTPAALRCALVVTGFRNRETPISVLHFLICRSHDKFIASRRCFSASVLVVNPLRSREVLSISCQG